MESLDGNAWSFERKNQLEKNKLSTLAVERRNTPVLCARQYGILVEIDRSVNTTLPGCQQWLSLSNGVSSILISSDTLLSSDQGLGLPYQIVD